MPQRTLSEAEFEQVKAQVLAGAPPNMTEAQFEQWIGPTFARALAAAEQRVTPQTLPGVPSPVASHRPAAEIARRDQSAVLTGLGVPAWTTGLDQPTNLPDVAGGARAGLAQSMFHTGDWIRRGLGLERVIDRPDAQALMTPPDSPEGRFGLAMERGAEFAIPLTRLAQTTRSLPFAARVGLEGAVGAGVAGVQTGGDPTAMVLGGLTGAAPATVLSAGVPIARTAQRAAAGAEEGGLGGAVAATIRSVAPGEPRTLLVQALKPRSTNLGFTSSLDRALPELKITEAALGRPIASVDDLVEAVKTAKTRVRAQYDEMAGPLRAAGSTVDLSPVADKIVSTIPKKLQIKNPDAALRIRTEADVYRQRFSLEDAEALLRETNAELESFYAKYPGSQRAALAADPVVAQLAAEAKALRDAIYETLDAPGQGTAARELQRRYGALLDVEQEAYRRANVAARQQPESLSEQLTKARAAGEYARGVYKMMRGQPLQGMADIVGAKVSRDMATFLKEQQTTNALIRRAFAGYRGAPEPVAMPSHAPRSAPVPPPRAATRTGTAPGLLPSHRTGTAWPPGR